MTTNPPPLPTRPLELTRLRVRNFRRIEQLDVEFPEEARVICFVGPNGSGKSSLLSILADSLCQLTKESAPDLDLAKGVISPFSSEPWKRNLHTFEIAHGTDAALILTHWRANGQSAIHSLLMRQLTMTTTSGSSSSSGLNRDVNSLNLWRIPFARSSMVTDAVEALQNA